MSSYRGDNSFIETDFNKSVTFDRRNSSGMNVMNTTMSGRP
jgi:hypothetical protein